MAGVEDCPVALGDFLNTPAESERAKPPLRINDFLTLSLRNISFGYSPDQTIIRDMSIDIGSRVPTLIIGESGCGKSTLAKLICGLYAPDKGHVEANGRSLADHDPHSVRRAIAYLPQEPALFSGSILDNLLLVKPDATEEEIERALVDSASDCIIARLPQGIHTEVGERGGYLSGGQRQRIALARALLTKPRALVLDEPTSALDVQATARVVETLKRLAEDKTLVVITHNSDLLGKNVRVIKLNAAERDDAPPELATA